MGANPLLALLCESARGRFPGRQDRLVILPPPPGRAMAIVGLPGRHIIASSAATGWIDDHLPADDLMAPLSPRFIAQLGAEIDRCDDGVDVLLAAPGLGGGPALAEIAPADHPRAVRARAHRDEVRTFTDASGAATVILGRGLGHRLEVGAEVLFFAGPRATT